MRKLHLTFVFLIISICSFGQILRFQGGPTLSKLDWELNTFGSIYNETFIGFSGLIGLDYLDNKNFNLSSNIGLIRKGGERKTTLVFEDNVENIDVIHKVYLDYLSVNTTIDFKYTIKEKLVPYISLGPRIDYLISYSDDFKGLKEINELNRMAYGFVIGIGVNFNLSKFQVGLKGDYFLNVNKIADWPASAGNLGGKISDRTIILNLIIGYRLK